MLPSTADDHESSAQNCEKTEHSHLNDKPKTQDLDASALEVLILLCSRVHACHNTHDEKDTNKLDTKRCDITSNKCEREEARRHPELTEATV